MNHEQVHELLYQALETELGGTHVYQTALQCTVNAELQHEWQKYLEQTETHAQILRELFATLKLNLAIPRSLLRGYRLKGRV